MGRYGPRGLAYAGIVGVPPIKGARYSQRCSSYTLLGTSQQLVVSQDTATGLISAVTVGAIVNQGHCGI
jgi:hypothetical protein